MGGVYARGAREGGVPKNKDPPNGGAPFGGLLRVSTGRESSAVARESIASGRNSPSGVLTLRPPRRVTVMEQRITSFR